MITLRSFWLVLACLAALSPSGARAAEANLQAADGSAIRITFQLGGGVGTPGSSAVSYFAEEVRIDVTIPWALPGSAYPVPGSGLAKLLATTKDGAYVDQYVQLIGVASTPSGARFTGVAPYALLIKSEDSGRQTRYPQQLEIDLLYNYGQYSRTLIDPIGNTTRFQTDLAAASGQ